MIFYSLRLYEQFSVELIVGQDNDATSALRIEFTSEVDLFFHYVHYMDELSFKTMVS